MRILLIGFEPFGGDAINSSQETVKAVACDELVGVEIMKEMLPVSFQMAGTEICRLIAESVPDIVIMLGQSGKSDFIKIERVALNLMDSSKEDNDGYIPDDETICAGAPAAYFTKMPVKTLRDSLIQSGIPAKVSNSAGLYVCNRTYFAALHHIATSGSKTKAVFIHLPKISDEWPVGRITTAIEQIITAIKY